MIRYLLQLRLVGKNGQIKGSLFLDSFRHFIPTDNQQINNYTLNKLLNDHYKDFKRFFKGRSGGLALLWMDVGTESFFAASTVVYEESQNEK